MTQEFIDAVDPHPSAQLDQQPDRLRRLRRRSMIASAVGNGLEWFDWNIYIVFTAALTAHAFSSDDPASALLMNFAIFGVGFVFRPVGGILGAWLADRHGRRTVMIITMLTMCGASLLIGLSPSFESVGVWASIVLLVARLAQGLAHGGESTAGYAYIAEIAPAKRRGLFSSTLAMGVLIGSVLASAIGWLLTSTLSEADMLSWGWRLPFFLGAALAIAVFFLRRTMMESESFTHELQGGDALAGSASTDGSEHTAPVDDSAASSQDAVTSLADDAATRRRVLWACFRIFWFVAAITIVFYTWLTSASSLAVVQHGMDPSAAFASSTVAQLLCVGLMPLMGWLSDRFGRKPLAFAFSVGFVVLSFPLLGLISDAPWTLLVAQSIALCFVAMGNSIYSAMLSEQLPTRYRARGIGITVSLSVAIFGGTALYINQWLHGLGMSWVFMLYFVIVCAASAVSVLFMKETKGIELRHA